MDFIVGKLDEKHLYSNSFQSNTKHQYNST